MISNDFHINRYVMQNILLLTTLIPMLLLAACGSQDGHTQSPGSTDPTPNQPTTAIVSWDVMPTMVDGVS